MQPLAHRVRTAIEQAQAELKSRLEEHDVVDLASLDQLTHGMISDSTLSAAEIGLMKELSVAYEFGALTFGHLLLTQPGVLLAWRTVNSQ